MSKTLTKQTIEIRAPKFELYEIVHLEWNGKDYKAKITRQLFDNQDGLWLYELNGNNKKLFPEDAISDRAYTRRLNYPSA